MGVNDRLTTTPSEVAGADIEVGEEEMQGNFTELEPAEELTIGLNSSDKETMGWRHLCMRNKCRLTLQQDINSHQ